MSYDHSKKYMDNRAMEIYTTSDPDVIKKFGREVRALEMSNREYGHRYSKLSGSRKMKYPPSSGRIFSGFLVVRNLGKKSEYETWMPDYVFEEVYIKPKQNT
ncbi:hypothetical protein QQ213_004487 [Vibrio vulnificus]|uniref:hypothetical protein n=1 Tax=Vibrio TaxID=662 RepID=UPI0005F11AF8|nr:hypothetical protein [Vibrio vulnificus]EJO9874898.1 hypothetical protein [Vibrio vulnificus]ELS0754628.1 hypothetical protein [Vibrio vulnificus]ELV8804772.1 hypothetical protein [Vibrio vulnificus]MBN8035125.1 hypothetical protein [Vibrio vulnificus]